MTRPLLLFAPGAGAPSLHPWMQAWSKRLSAIGDVVLLDYPYMKQKRRRPDPLPALIAAHRDVLAGARRDSATFLIGKSMGGRIGCHLALEEQVNGVICLGYPLCGQGDRSRMRDKVLRELRTPILFVQGTRDALCPLELLEEVRTEITAPNFLYIVEGGDHSLNVSKRQLAVDCATQDEVDQRILGEIEKFTSANSP